MDIEDENASFLLSLVLVVFAQLLLLRPHANNMFIFTLKA